MSVRPPGYGSGSPLERDLADLKRKLALLGKVYTVASAPDPTKYKTLSAYFADGAAGSPILAFSDGSAWLRCDTRTAISAS